MILFFLIFSGSAALEDGLERCAKKQRLNPTDTSSEENFSSSSLRHKLNPMPDVLPLKTRVEAGNIAASNDVTTSDDSTTPHQTQPLTSALGTFHFPLGYSASHLPAHLPSDPTPANPFTVHDHVTSQTTAPSFMSQQQEGGEAQVGSASQHHLMQHSTPSYQSPFGTSSH